MNPYLVGLTGGIGCGKTAVSDAFAALGVAVVDTDVIARELAAPGGAAVPALREAFGAAFIDAAGGLDRARMRQLAFADPAARARLEAILHPRIRAESDAQLAAATSPYALLVVPLLIESGNYRQRVARVLVVDCPVDVQVARVMARSGLSADEAAAIIAAQVPRDVRRAAADDIVENTGSKATLRDKVAELHARYCEIAEKMSGNTVQSR